MPGWTSPDGYAPTHDGRKLSSAGASHSGVSQKLLFAGFYPGERPSAAELALQARDARR